MRIIKISLILSIIINIILAVYINFNNNQMEDTLSRLTFVIQRNLVELESSIDYQIQNNWIDENLVLEKIEDVRESINTIMVTGRDSGVITTEQEQDLWNLYNFLRKYPEYTGFPNTVLNNNQRNEIKELRGKLRTAGWGMNISYRGSWESFRKSIKILLE